MLLLITSVYYILIYEKITIHLYLNKFVGHEILDNFFFYITFFGDGTVAAFLIVAAGLYNIRLGIYAALSFLSSTVISVGMKYLFFDDVNRPSFIFKYIHKHAITYVDGVGQHLHNSFPSGHATQAFAILMCFVFYSKNQSVKMLFFLVALLSSFSRVYLSQHWLTDVVAGSIIGTFFAMLYYFIIHRDKFPKLNRSVFKNTSV